MPELSGFVRIRYSTKGPAAHAMRVLNEHLEQSPLPEGEAESRILSFLSAREKREQDNR